jgi:dihydrofolate synthase/folylpolyglutamate synthase
MAQKAGLKGMAYPSVSEALHAASLKAAKNDIIIVCGSIFLVGEVSPGMVDEIWKKMDISMMD